MKAIDVSSWQGVIDWKKVKADGVVAAVIRYADGSYLDKQFDRNMREAKKNGIHFGAYIFSRATSAAQAAEEAERLYMAAKKYAPDLPLYIDLEADNLARKANTLASAFLKKMDALGVVGGIYANLNWFTHYISAQKFKSRPLWIAQYNTKLTAAHPEWFGMWQYSSKGKVSGISGNVDMNHLYMKYWEKSKKASTTSKSTKKSVTEIAQEVIAGKWGNGTDRKKRLTKAGYDYDKVQKKVNELLK
jgi:lysozyme